MAEFWLTDRLGFRTETPATRTMADDAAPEHDLIAAAEAAEAAAAAVSAPQCSLRPKIEIESKLLAC